MNHFFTRTIPALLTVLGVGVLSGCSQPAPKDTHAASAEKISAVTAKFDVENGWVSMPLDEYQPTEADFANFSRAVGLVQRDCMIQKGQPYAAVEQISQMRAPENRLFGLWSVPLAEQYGFDLPAVTDMKSLSSSALSEFESVPGWQEDQKSCDSGTDDALGYEVSTLFKLQSELPAQLSTESYDSVVESAEAKLLIEKYHSCLTQAGYTPSAENFLAIEEQPGTQTEEDRYAAAVAEATCNDNTKFAQGMFNLQAKAQAALIETHEADLKVFADQIRDIRTKNEAAILKYSGK